MTEKAEGIRNIALVAHGGAKMAASILNAVGNSSLIDGIPGSNCAKVDWRKIFEASTHTT